MKTIAEYLTITDGKSPEQVRRWYSRLPDEEKLQLEIAFAYIADEHQPHPFFHSHRLPSLDYYDRSGGGGLLCRWSRDEVHHVAGKNE